MDLVNDLSSDLAMAVLVDGSLGTKLTPEDAKSFIALVEQELERISATASGSDLQRASPPAHTELSH